MSDDRRLRPRHEVWIDFEIEGRNTLPGDYVYNISLGGAFIRTRTPLPHETRLRITLKTPDGAPNLLDAEVVRCIDEVSALARGVPPGMGIEFLDLGRGEPERAVQKLLMAHHIIEAIDPSEAPSDTVTTELNAFIRRAKKAAPHTILGVDSAAEGAEIQRAYRALSKKYHPDRLFYSGNKIAHDLAREAFGLINEAYRDLTTFVLRDGQSSGAHIADSKRIERVQGYLTSAQEALRRSRPLRARILTQMALEAAPTFPPALALDQEIASQYDFFIAR